jgi:hypothetical protein
VQRRLRSEVCKVCAGDAPSREAVCHTCYKRRRKPDEVIHERKSSGAVWRRDLVEAAMAAKPPDFWTSPGWDGGKHRRVDSVKALLGADCFEPGGIAGPGPPSAVHTAMLKQPGDAVAAKRPCGGSGLSRSTALHANKCILCRMADAVRGVRCEVCRVLRVRVHNAVACRKLRCSRTVAAAEAQAGTWVPRCQMSGADVLSTLLGPDWRSHFAPAERRAEQVGSAAEPAVQGGGSVGGAAAEPLERGPSSSTGHSDCSAQGTM